MKNYEELFTEDMNSGELRLKLIAEMRECKTQEEKDALKKAYMNVHSVVHKKEMADIDVMTSY